MQKTKTIAKIQNVDNYLLLGGRACQLEAHSATCSAVALVAGRDASLPQIAT